MAYRSEFSKKVAHDSLNIMIVFKFMAVKSINKTFDSNYSFYGTYDSYSIIYISI